MNRIKTSSQQLDAILSDPAASTAMKAAVREMAGRDPVDAINDLAYLLPIFALRLVEASQPTTAPGTVPELQKLKAEWYKEAEDSGLLSIIGLVCREIGRDLRQTYGPKYKLEIEPAIELFVDDYGGYMTVHQGGRPVCNTHTCSRLFVPGDWVHPVTELYTRALIQKEQREAKKRMDKAGELAKELHIA